MTNKYILAISGNDIFSGGGLYADLATYTTNHLHGFLAVTCLTALTENGFDVFATDETVFSHQLNSLKDVPFSGIKLGLLPNVKVADLALEFVESHVGIPIVLDPVLVIYVLVGICHPIYLIQFVDVQLFVELFYSPYFLKIILNILLFSFENLCL